MLKELLVIIGVVSLFVNLYWLVLYFFYGKKIFTENLSKKKRFVSILVPAYNEGVNVIPCLESLVGLDYDKNYCEVIVVDDGSSDNTFDVAKSFALKFPFIKVFRNEKNSGMKSKALNIALKKISKKSEIVVVLDADSVVNSDTLRKVLTFFDNGYDAVSMRYMPLNRKSILAKFQVFEYMYSALWRKILSILNSMYVTPGVFSAYTLKSLKKVGYFRSDCLTEDMELALRFQKAGFKIGYSFTTTAYTKVPESLSKFIKQRERWYRGYLDSMRIHKDVLFNTRFGNFGAIMMPINIISSSLVIVISFTIMYTVLKSFFDVFTIFYKFYLINFDLITYFSSIDFTSFVFYDWFKHVLLQLDLFSFVAFFSLVLAFIMLYIVKKKTGEAQGKDLLLFPFFLLFYLPLNSMLWLYSLTLEFFRAGKKW